MKALGKIVAGIFLSVSMMAQTVTAGVADLPVTNLNGQLYFYYEVQPKETIYSLTHKLGVTREQILASNPSVADGLKAHSVLYFPVTEADLAAGAGRKTHVVAKGETIYGISRQYGLTPDRLVELNPGVRDGLKTGMKLLVGTVESPETAATVSGSPAVKSGRCHGYLVKAGETLYSIARANNVTVADIEAVNPELTVPKAGQVINIPDVEDVYVKAHPTPAGVEGEVTVVTPISSTIEAIEPPLAAETVGETAVAEEVTAPAETRIAVMLPFMLNQPKMSRATARMLEFYQGFLIAADSLRNSGNSIKLYSYDTAASNDTVAALLANPELKKMNVIIAPDDEQQLAMIARFGRDNGVAVFNPFVVKDSAYIENPVMIQANIGHDLMYAKAVEGLVARLGGATPVFLSRSGGATDKADFVEALKARFNNEGIKWKELGYTGKLTSANLKDLPSGNYVFIPESGRLSEANTFLVALDEAREGALVDGGSIRVWGYPEWIAFKGDALEKIQSLDALIYSRFASEIGSDEARGINYAFKRWYGSEMAEAVPCQGTFGFDAGMFIIKSLNGNGKSLLGNDVPVYRGVQYSFILEPREGVAGRENGALYIVNFRPSGLVESTLLP